MVNIKRYQDKDRRTRPPCFYRLRYLWELSLPRYKFSEFENIFPILQCSLRFFPVFGSHSSGQVALSILLPFVHLAPVGFTSISQIFPTMFAATTVLFISLLSLTSEVIAKPLSFIREQALMARNAPNMLFARDNNVSFSNWNNISALQGFDDFNGQGNFNGRNNDQKIVINEVETRCETVKITIVQQKLAILQELAKRIITEQICDVQTQTIVLEQHNGALEVFRDDIQRKVVTKQVGFDQQIASKFSSIVNTDGSLSVDDAGFKGSDVGQNLVVPTGNNWDNSTSPALVQAAQAAADSANNSTSS
ncbi:hypothetical protein B0H16DRAFT_1511608 [Mycena metata]|uniref:Uncharacterized protein n=1 Tax=Mycena metata TaxID=1033252 RepID=A0AAD7JWD9_9AGAR|nr:hypothetical protein B0H16DRAFT_1511608 [Mycena metata]